MASFLTACQSGSLRAGRRADRLAGACGLRCAPAARQGPIAAAAASQWQTPDIQAILNPQNDRTLATNSQTCRTSTAESSGLKSQLHWWSGRPKARLASLRWSLHPGVQKSTTKTTSKPYLSWRWSLERWGDNHWTFEQDEAIWRSFSHTARDTQKWCEENCPSFITKGPVAPVIAWAESYGLHDVVRAWERTHSKPRKNIWSVSDRRSLTQAVRAAIGDFERRLATTVRVRGDHFE